MATIDQYKHKLLGFIECPSKENFVYLNATRSIPIYQLLQDIPDNEEDFDGKQGDILMGGGSGGAPALRISSEKCLRYFMLDEDVDFDHWDDLYKAFWTPTESYIYGEGFSKVGWSVDRTMENWLTDNICKILSEEFEEYAMFKNGLRRGKKMLRWKRE